jgi:hypothetical protein
LTPAEATTFSIEMSGVVFGIEIGVRSSTLHIRTSIRGFR